jgi:hypothetical protein
MPHTLMQVVLREPVEQPAVAKPSGALARSRELPPRSGRTRQPHHPVRRFRPDRQLPKPALDRLEVHPGDYRRDDPHVSCPHQGRAARHRTPRASRAPHPPRRRRCQMVRSGSGRRNHRRCWKQHDQPRSPAQRQRFRWLPGPSTVQPPHQWYRRQRAPSMGRLWPQRSRQPPPRAWWSLSDRSPWRSAVPESSCRRLPGLGRPLASRRQTWLATPVLSRLGPPPSRGLYQKRRPPRSHA